MAIKMMVFPLSVMSQSDSTGYLAVVHRDCSVTGGFGQSYAHLNSITPNNFTVGHSPPLAIVGDLESDVSRITFNGALSIKGVSVANCTGDGTEDLFCSHPLGNITVKAVDLPLKKGKLNLEMHVDTDKVLGGVIPYDFVLHAVDQQNQTVLCTEMLTQLGWCIGMQTDKLDHWETEENVLTVGQTLHIGPDETSGDESHYHEDFCHTHGNLCVDGVEDVAKLPTWGNSEVIEIPTHSTKLAGTSHKILSVRGTKYNRALACHRLADGSKIGCHKEHLHSSALWTVTTEMKRLGSDETEIATLRMMCHEAGCHVVTPGSMMVVPKETGELTVV